MTLVEKQARTGGSTALSGGFFAFAGTPLQKRLGIADDAAMLYDDLYEVSQRRAHPELLRAYCSGQRDLFDWLEAQDIRFTSVELSSGQSTPRSHKTDAKTMLDILRQRALRTQCVDIKSETAAVRLVRDDERVSGVVLSQNASEFTIEAGNGVILTSGGFARSEELLATFAPRMLGVMRHGGMGNTGDGLKMAWQLGAGFADMGEIKTTFGTHPNTGDDRHELILAYYLGAIIVNSAGERFVDELKSYKSLGDACLGQPGNMAFQIFDQRIRDKSEPGVLTYDLSVPEERGLMLRADSIEELARLCKLDPATLSATVTRYNKGVASGRDTAFGRDGLCNHTGQLTPIDAPPFYAYPSTSFINTTYCGLTIDSDARVLDVFNQPIPGLFAAGEITGGFHGGAYMTGSSLGKAAFFGRVAGRNVARRNAPL